MQVFDQFDCEQLFNQNKELVLEIIEEVMLEHGVACTCRDCRMDVAAITLNKIPAKYIVSDSHANDYLDFEVDVNKDKVVSIIKDAIDVVLSNPHHVN